LDDAARDLEVAAAAESRCRGLLGCLIGAAVSPVVSLLQGLVDVVTDTAGAVLTTVAPPGALVHGILGDLLRLDIARAELELIEVSCNRNGVHLAY